MDLLEYVLVSAGSVEALGAVAEATAELVRDGSVRLLDAVVLARSTGRTTVEFSAPARHQELAVLRAAEQSPVLLSRHDVELAAVTVAPGEAALLLLLEDRWARRLSVAARAGGGRLAAGERISRERVSASELQPEPGSVRAGGADLLARAPGTSAVIDRVEQVHQLARLVDSGLLSLDQYEVQRGKVLDG
jgi:hypothetical protein